MGPVSGFPSQFFPPHLPGPLSKTEMQRSDMETQTCTHRDTQKWRDIYRDRDRDTRRDIYGDTHKQVELDSHKNAIRETWAKPHIDTCRHTQDIQIQTQMET